MRPLVLYHAGCADGLTAAWVVWRRFGREAECRPVQYGDAPPDCSRRDVYVLDFSWPRVELLRMHRQATSLLVIDHHKTAKAELEGLDFCHFDMERSGARLAWNYFGRSDIGPTWLVDYVQDRDLWRWTLYESKAVNATIQSWPKTLEDWDRLNLISLAAAVEQGQAIRRCEMALVAQLCQAPREVELDGHRVLAVNAPVLQSEVCERLAEGRPFGACWFELADGRRVWSLRSREPSPVDVSEVAKRRGGGGHARAAGFTEAALGRVA